MWGSLKIEVRGSRDKEEKGLEEDTNNVSLQGEKGKEWR
jgi:hypothetical protein